MYSRRSREDDGTISRPFRTSDRLNSRPKLYGRPYLYHTPTTIIRPKIRKTKTRIVASRIAKMFCPSDRLLRTSNRNSVMTNLRHSTRKRRMSENQEEYTNSFGIDENLHHKRKGKPSRLDTLLAFLNIPKMAYGPKVSELKAKAETERNALRRLHMCLRDVCNRILYDKSFSIFHFPVMDKDAPNYHSIIQNPMDMATLMQHVENGKYMTYKSFLEDFYLIVANAMKYNGNDYNKARIVSRAYKLQDAVHGMLSQMDPALVAFCEKIVDKGGPLSMSNELGSSTLPKTPIVHTTTCARARLHNV